MAAETGIEWTGSTQNFWVGCTHVSEGCRNCYMFTDMKRYGNDPKIVRRTKTWKDPIKWNREAAKEGKKRLVFTCSFSDFFHPAADEWRPEAWQLIRDTPDIVYQIITKRANLVAARLPSDWGGGYPNVWLGVSAEDQTSADARIPILLRTPAAIRFVSLEPLLGPISLRRLPYADEIDLDSLGGRLVPLVQHRAVPPSLFPSKLDWVIVGGESGPGARPMHHCWARNLRDQCESTGIPFFFKQWGEWISEDESSAVREGHWKRIDFNGRDVTGLPGLYDDSDAIVRRVGKKDAGRTLDGREWSEMPRYDMEVR